MQKWVQYIEPILRRIALTALAFALAGGAIAVGVLLAGR